MGDDLLDPESFRVAVGTAATSAKAMAKDHAAQSIAIYTPLIGNFKAWLAPYAYTSEEIKYFHKKSDAIGEIVIEAVPQDIDLLGTRISYRNYAVEDDKVNVVVRQKTNGEEVQELAKEGQEVLRIKMEKIKMKFEDNTWIEPWKIGTSAIHFLKSLPPADREIFPVDFIVDDPKAAHKFFEAMAQTLEAHSEDMELVKRWKHHARDLFPPRPSLGKGFDHGDSLRWLRSSNRDILGLGLHQRPFGAHTFLPPLVVPELTRWHTDPRKNVRHRTNLPRPAEHIPATDRLYRPGHEEGALTNRTEHVIAHGEGATAEGTAALRRQERIALRDGLANPPQQQQADQQQGRRYDTRERERDHPGGVGAAGGGVAVLRPEPQRAVPRHYCPTEGCKYHSQALGHLYASCDHFGPSKCQYWNCGTGACSGLMRKHEQDECPWHAEARRKEEAERHALLKRQDAIAKQGQRKPKRSQADLAIDRIIEGSANDGKVPRREKARQDDNSKFDKNRQTAKPFPNAHDVLPHLLVKDYYSDDLGMTVDAVEGGWSVRWIQGGETTKVLQKNLYRVELK